MKKKLGISILIVVIFIAVLFAFSKNPIVSCKIEIPQNYMEAVKDQAEGLYSKRLPLIPVYVRVEHYTEETLYYTIYYFPLGAVGRSYTGGDGYNIEKPLTNM